MIDNVIQLDGYRPPTPSERLEAIVRLAANGLGLGETYALETLRAVASALSDLLDEREP